MENIKISCKKCSNKKRMEFQKTNYIEELKKIDILLNEERFKKVQNPHYVLKVPMQSLEKYYNEEDDVCFYVNSFDDTFDGDVEHVWIEVFDINFERKTVCGVLRNNPIIFNVNIGDIMIFDFKDIEAIEEYIYY